MPEQRISLVPTRVGMIFVETYQTLPYDSCPHTRGDDPRLKHYKQTC